MNVYYSKKTFGPIVYFEDPLSCRIGLSFLIKWKHVASCKPPEDLGLFSKTFFLRKQRLVNSLFFSSGIEIESKMVDD